MSLTIRPASPADLPSITAIYAEAVRCGSASYELEAPDEAEMHTRFAALSSRGYPYSVALSEDGMVLGYAYAGPFRSRPAYRWMVEDSIYLAEPARGRGVGRALLAATIEKSEALGFRQMVAVIGGASPASVGLHRSLGFAMVGTLVGAGFKHGGWLDTVFMQRALGDGAGTLPDEHAYPGNLYRG